MTKFFKESRKPYFGGHLGPFFQIWAKMQKRALPVFTYENYLPSYSELESNEPFLRKMPN